ncbi:MAG: hypothetical protein K2Y01_01470 [Rhabdochlamydiaceae bacterium]|nr:hypothetical protein [Rhabdochlamydiaceae bacterium]
MNSIEYPIFTNSNFDLIKSGLDNQKSLPTELPKGNELTELFQKYERLNINPLNVVRLVFLAKISGLDENTLSHFSPFRETEEAVFKLAKDRMQRASKWLRAGLIGTTVLTVTPFVGAVPSVSSWATKNPTNNLNLVIGFIAIAALVNVINFIATGTFPDLQTSSAAKASLKLEAASSTYSDLSHELKLMHEQGLSEAGTIAQALDVEKIKRRIVSSLVSAEYRAVADKLCNNLNKVRYSVLSNSVPGLEFSAKIRLEHFRRHELQHPRHANTSYFTNLDQVV